MAVGAGAGEGATPVAGSFGSEDAALVEPLLEPAEPALATPVGSSPQVHRAGQSPSTLQVVALGVHEPGKLVVVVQVGGVTGVTGNVGSGALAGAAPASTAGLTPLDASAPPALPEHSPPVVGVQVKPAPQSSSLLHGTCHL